MNTFKLTIGDKVIKSTPYGAKFGNLLDERLDEGYITLKHLKQEQPFRPFTLVKIEHTNANTAFRTKMKKRNVDIYQDEIYQTIQYNMLTQIKEEYFFIADDSVTNYPTGSEFYNHSLYIIEITKLLERFIGDSITFTNQLNNK